MVAWPYEAPLRMGGPYRGTVRRRVHRGHGQHLAMTTTEQPSFRCPRCKRVSYNLNDVKEHYCGSCHEWADNMEPSDPVRRGWFNLPCFNALGPEQQERLVTWGNLPFGYKPEGGRCQNGAEVGIECQGDEYPGPRFYCRPCAIEYLSATKPATMS